jgi:hypothetical protein
MDMKNKQAAWKCSRDKQQEFAAWTSNMNMQVFLLHADMTWAFSTHIQHGKVTWKYCIDTQHVHVARICSTEKRHARCSDTQPWNAPWTFSNDIQHEQAS